MIILLKRLQEAFKENERVLSEYEDHINDEQNIDELAEGASNIEREISEKDFDMAGFYGQEEQETDTDFEMDIWN